MWRDEFGAWLIARDTASPLEIFRQIKCEGHPSLWFILLWPLAHATRAPAPMQVLNVLIASGTVCLVLRWAPGPR